MDIETIKRLLTNSGFHVIGTDPSQTLLLVEDPSCIMRSFQTFLEYAWVFITLITAILLFGWAISKIRGANTDIAINIRNLLIMFGVLSASGPILNVIYGGNLMARTCNIVQIPLADIQEILDTRNSQLSPNDRLFEDIDIFDSGMRPTDANDSGLPPVDVPDVTFQTDPDTGEPIPIYNNNNSGDASTPPAQNSNPAPTEQNNANNGTPSVNFNSNAPTSARAISRNVIQYSYNDGTTYRHNNGSPAWRHTNPGNIINGNFTAQHGAIGRGYRFAIFPSEEVGRQAIISLLRSPSYANLSIQNAMKRYAPAADNNDPVRYAQYISQQTGLDANRKLNTLNDTEINRVANIIKRYEGWIPGTVTR